MFVNYSNNIHAITINNTSFPNLKSIVIGSQSFQNVHVFVVFNLHYLDSLNIGCKCFRISWNERNDGICRITNCPNLRQLIIGDDSFEDFQSFELSNLNSLQSIKFGDYCLYYADFSLKGELKERMNEM